MLPPFIPFIIQASLGALIAVALLLLAPKLGGPAPTWMRFPLAGGIGGAAYILVGAVFVGYAPSLPVSSVLASAIIGALVGLLAAGIWARNSTLKKAVEEPKT